MWSSCWSCWACCLTLYAKVEGGLGIQIWQFLNPPASCWRTLLLPVGLELASCKLCKIIWWNKWERNKFLSAYEQNTSPARLNHVNIVCGKEIISLILILLQLQSQNTNPYMRIWGKISLAWADKVSNSLAKEFTLVNLLNYFLDHSICKKFPICCIHVHTQV